MAASLRLAVVSDIHAFSSDILQPGDPTPSWIDISRVSSDPGSNPFDALASLIEEESLVADILVCGGDIGDRAHPGAIQYSWNRLRDIAAKLGRAEIVATTGNHDLDSRGTHNGHDARATLLSLEDYPFTDEALNNEYWARNVVVLERADYRIATLNSAAYHGFKDEYKHGRISKTTAQYLRRKLEKGGERTVNILVCHHHVHKIGTLDLEDYSEMTDAQLLVDVLSDEDFGPWLVIHGHRHWPSISYPAGGDSAPVVFAAGSLAAILYPELNGRANNQFYLLDIPLDQSNAGIRGTFRAWDYTWGTGFSPAKASGSGLPHSGGFGVRRRGKDVALDVQRAFVEAAKSHMDWHQVVDRVPDLQFLAPGSLATCLKQLTEQLGMTVLADQNGSPAQIGAKQ